jgi:hypothetical protein
MSSSPGPHKLHWLAHFLGDQDRLAHLVVDRAASETAAEEAVVHDDLLGLESGCGSRLADGSHWRLRAEPDLQSVGLGSLVQIQPPNPALSRNLLPTKKALGSVWEAAKPRFEMRI